MPLVMGGRAASDHVPFFPLLYSILIVCGLALLVTFWSPAQTIASCGNVRSYEKPAPLWDYNNLATGPLALKNSGSASFITYLRDELLVLAKNTRPDAPKDGAEVLLRLRTAQKDLPVKDGTQIFLESFIKDDGRIQITGFSHAPTELMVRPLVLDPERALIEVSLDSETRQFVSQLSSQLGARVDSLLHKIDSPIALLKQAKLWGPDLLLQNYGGEEYKELSHKHKIEIGEGSRSYVCFVGAGDCLVWDGTVWKTVALEEILKGQPVAMIKRINAKKMEIEAWDATGFYATSWNLEQPLQPKAQLKLEQLPASVRVRTTTQVSCTLGGKKRLILRQGDWLLRTSTGWRNLRKEHEIEGCIQHKLRGELFIFDKLEREKGKNFLKGHMFDEMRTQMQSVSIPITADIPKMVQKFAFSRRQSLAIQVA